MAEDSRRDTEDTTPVTMVGMVNGKQYNFLEGKTVAVNLPDRLFDEAETNVFAI